MPVLDQRRMHSRLSISVRGYTQPLPVAYEVVYQDERFLRQGLAAIRERGGRVWVNTLKPEHAAGIYDAIAIEKPDATWGHLVSLGVNMIQTDNPEELMQWLKKSEK